MSTAREKFFLCSAGAGARRITRQLRAWDERQAALLFQELLEEEGVALRGQVRVTDLHGQRGDRYEQQGDALA